MIPVQRRSHVLVLVPLSLLAVVSTLVLSAALDEKRLSVYSPVADYSLSVMERDGREYVGLLEILEPIGPVNAKIQDKKWKLRFNDVDSQFSPGASRARIRGKDVDLPAPFLLENRRGLVPVDSLVTLLPHFLGFPITFHVGARRLFIKEEGTTYVTGFSRTAPPKLVMNFSSPVNPTIATEPGKLRMVFVRDPLLLSGSDTANFNDKTIPSANFQEANGAIEITVNATVPLLASFSNDGRTITIAPAPSAAAQASAQPEAVPPLPGAVTPSPAGAAPPPSSGSMRVFAVIDPSHGGDERGAALSGQMAEKDVTLVLARRIRQELENRGLATSILRDSDSTMTLDQRASAANSAHPAIYISLHAAGEGAGVRVFTALMPSGGDNLGPFVAWERAQFPFLTTSQAAAASIASELRKNLPVRALAAPLRPLNNLTAAALAIEVAPQAGNVDNLNSPDYQQLIAVSIANGLIAARGRLEAAH